MISEGKTDVTIAAIGIGVGSALNGTGLICAGCLAERVPQVKLVAEAAKVVLADTLFLSLGKMLSQAEGFGGLQSFLHNAAFRMIQTPSGELLIKAGGVMMVGGLLVGSGVILADRLIPRLRRRRFDQQHRGKDPSDR